ncbi:MAG: N-formylglutamate amidohydrolase [Spirochaetales bacterium]|nr:N-formylglutamate amidohydrolase [Spirochaetales bacterium]
MKSYRKIITYIPHSSIENYSWGWNNLYQTAENNSFQMFESVKNHTDWHIDLLFGIPMKGVEVCRFPYSLLFVDTGVENVNPDKLYFGVVKKDFCGHQRHLIDDDYNRLVQIYRDFIDGVKDKIIDRTLVLNCRSHSWKHNPEIWLKCNKDEAPDIILGYREGDTQPDRGLVDYIADQFRGRGYSVEVNASTLPDKFLETGKKQHDNLYISVNRKCYMDEESLIPKFDECVKLRGVMVSICKHVLGDNEAEERAWEYLHTKQRTPVYEGVMYKRNFRRSDPLPLVVSNHWALTEDDIDHIRQKLISAAVPASCTDRIDNAKPGHMMIWKGKDERLDSLFFANIESNEFYDSESIDTVQVDIDHEKYLYRFRQVAYNPDKNELLEAETARVPLTDEDYVFLLGKCVQDGGYTFNRLTRDHPRLAAELCKKTDCVWYEDPETPVDRPYFLLFDEAAEDAKAIRESMKSNNETADK